MRPSRRRVSFAKAPYLQTLLAFASQILDEAPVAARIHLNVSDILARDHDVRLIPHRKHRYVATHHVLNLLVELATPYAIERIHRFFHKPVELGIAVAAPVARDLVSRRDLRSRKQIFVEDRILITANPLRVADLKIASAHFIKQRGALVGLDLDRDTHFLELVLNHDRVVSPGDAASRQAVSNRFVEPCAWSSAVEVTESRLIEQSFRRSGIK